VVQGTAPRRRNAAGTGGLLEGEQSVCAKRANSVLWKGWGLQICRQYFRRWRVHGFQRDVASARALGGLAGEKGQRLCGGGTYRGEVPAHRIVREGRSYALLNVHRAFPRAHRRVPDLAGYHEIAIWRVRGEWARPAMGRPGRVALKCPGKQIMPARSVRGRAANEMWRCLLPEIWMSNAGSPGSGS